MYVPHMVVGIHKSDNILMEKSNGEDAIFTEGDQGRPQG